MMLIDILIAFLLGIVLICILFIAGYFYKMTRQNVKNGISFVYHLLPKKLPMPVMTQSPYFNRYPDKSRKWTRDYWSMCPCIDDPWMRELAKEIDEACKGKSERYKAGYILKIAQCIYTYKSDKKIYEEIDRWQYPVCTAYLRTGDCEDGTFIGAGLSYLCGLDTIVMHTQGHALYGVNVKGFGLMSVKFDGKRYLLCETTTLLPIGMTLCSEQVQEAYYVKMPRTDFISELSFIDQYDKYKK